MEFDYDWRLDNEGTVGRLAKVIDDLHASGVRNIHVIAHSMGALITSYYLRYGNARFDAAQENWAGAGKLTTVTLAGAPFLGSIETFHDIEYGELTFRNKTLLSSESLASFPSMYQLLPAPSVCAVTPCDENNLFTPDFWITNSWGICNQKDPATEDGRMKFLSNQLAQGKRFFELLHAPPSGPPPANLRLIHVSGSTSATPARISWAHGKPVDEKEYNRRLQFENGDGVVTAESAELPAAYRPLMAEHIDSVLLHQSLYDDEKVQNAILKTIEERTDTTNH
jgi:hypothetical protein